MNKQISTKLMAVAVATISGSTWAIDFELSEGSIKGNFDSTVTTGLGVRAKSPGCDTVIGTALGGSANGGFDTPPSGGGTSGCLDALSNYNDQGNLNYKKGQMFTQYLKGTHELLLRLPSEDIKFMARANWIKDFAATHTSGYVSGIGGPALTDDAKSELSFKARMLDLWVSKEFDLNDERARVRVGNQVVSWGESLFIAGGVNQTNAVDIMRLSQPGTQLKEAFLPAPIASFATGVGGGVNVEAYVQGKWNANYLPPVGSYWSTSTIGAGASQVADGLPNTAVPTANTPRNNGQYGLAAHYQPQGTQLNLGAYAMNYHDKSPQVIQVNGAANYTYLEDRKMYGLSANFPLGNWAVGTELSYRPKDGVPLNAAVVDPTSDGCLNGKCYVEEAKYQFHLVGVLQLSPGEHGMILNLLGADTGFLLAEAAAVRYPNLKDYYMSAAGNPMPLAPGAWFWGRLTANDGGFTSHDAPVVATKTAWAYNFDFSWTYDGSLIRGWQVTPEVYYFQAVKGRSPSSSGVFMEGQKSANFVLTFAQNPANWQFAVNYAKFWGGSSVFDQPLRGRDFYGAYVSRNF